METNKEKGTKLEIYVAEKLQEVFQETPSIRPSKASGGGSHNTECGDITAKSVYVECKAHEGKFFDKKVWEKLLNEIPMGSMKAVLYVIRDPIEGELVMLTLNDLCRLLKEKR